MESADDLTVANACKPPSIIYAMQGPFPIEIYQGTELIVFKLEYYDMVRIIFMDGRKAPENAPHTKTGYSVATGKDPRSSSRRRTSRPRPSPTTA